MPKKSALPDFERSLAELEKIVEGMEGGGQSLEQALGAFQRGVELARQCEHGLKEAEQRVEKLVEKDGVLRIEAMDDSDLA